MNFLKAVFNFFVGDWIILIGVAIVLVIAGLLANMTNLTILSGYIIIVGVIATLAVTLRHEVS